MPVLQSKHLQLTPLGPADVSDIHALWTHPDVRRYLWDDEIIATDLVEEIVERNQQMFESENAGLFAARFPGTDAIVGFAGFWYFHEPPELQLIYGLHPDHWGKGLATELADATIKFGFEELGYEAIVGSTDTPNEASKRVMERAGMTFQKRITINGKETDYFSITPTP